FTVMDRDLHTFPTRRSSDISRPGGKQRIFLTFYSMGFHEYRERWVYQEWYWYESVRGAGMEHRRVPRNAARQQIDERYRECQARTEDHMSELQSRENLVCRL